MQKLFNQTNYGLAADTEADDVNAAASPKAGNVGSSMINAENGTEDSTSQVMKGTVDDSVFEVEDDFDDSDLILAATQEPFTTERIRVVDKTEAPTVKIAQPGDKDDLENGYDNLSLCNLSDEYDSLVNDKEDENNAEEISGAEAESTGISEFDEAEHGDDTEHAASTEHEAATENEATIENEQDSNMIISPSQDSLLHRVAGVRGVLTETNYATLSMDQTMMVATDIICANSQGSLGSILKTQRSKNPKIKIANPSPI